MTKATHRLSLAFLLSCLLTLPAPAAQTRSAGNDGSVQQPPSEHTLVSVKVTGSKRYTQDEIVAASGLQMGANVGDEDFQKAAHQLGDSGAFSDISYKFSYSSAGTKLALDVTDATKFLAVHLEDFVWFTDEELLRKVHGRVPLFKGDLPASGKMPDEVSDILQALLVENGVPGHVEYLRSTGKSGDLESFAYSVSGITIRIRDVAFVGAGAAELPHLRAAAEKLPDREYSRDRLSSFVQHVLVPIYHERGYLKASFAPPESKVVKSATSEANASNHYETLVDVTLAVTPGLQYALTGITWTGNKDISSDTLQALLHAKIGAPANTEQLAEDLRQVQSLYGSRGYITATIKADAQFDDPASTVAVNLTVNEGYVYHMGDIDFRGIDNSLTAKLKATWKLRPGDVYDSTYLKQFLASARKLLPANLDWDVSSHVTANVKDKSVDVDVVYSAKAPE